MKYAIIIVGGLLALALINLLAFTFKSLLSDELSGTIGSLMIFSLLFLVVGIILIIKSLLHWGWALILGAILNIIVWIYLLNKLASHGW